MDDLKSFTTTMNIKKYLPFENYVLISELSAEELTKRLAANIEPKRNVRFPGSNKNSNKPYEGQISGDSFTITRVIDYRNSFLPVITGHISATPRKTQINVKMQPTTFVLAFISLWLGIVGLVCLGTIVAGVIQFKHHLRDGFSPAVLVPFGMFLLGYLLTILSFKAESKNAKYFLERLFEGQQNA